jgi:hypothetical protein
MEGFSSTREMLSILKSEDIFISKDNTQQEVDLIREGEIRGLVVKHGRFSYRITEKGMDHLLDLMTAEQLPIATPISTWDKITQNSLWKKGSKTLSWIIVHAWQIISAIIVGYILYRLKWN